MSRVAEKVTLNWDRLRRTRQSEDKDRDFGFTEKLADSWAWEEAPE